jgi:hypothetical protein
MAKNDWYQVRSSADSPTLFVITKVDDDDNPTGFYNIAIDLEHPRSRPTCTCPRAYRRMPCRHLDILKLFQDTKRIDTGYRYSYDKKIWKEPLSLDLE